MSGLRRLKVARQVERLSQEDRVLLGNKAADVQASARKRAMLVRIFQADQVVLATTQPNWARPEVKVSGRAGVSSS
jgi:hypothetical protein